MRVGDGERGPAPLWLEGATYDRFDGRGWTRSKEADRPVEIRQVLF